MNYEQNYYDLVKSIQLKKRKKSDDFYYEEHHILPRSLGGNNKKSNLVLLTPREHYLCHYLLWKFARTKETTDSFAAMSKNSEYAPYIFSINAYEKVIQESKQLRYKKRLPKRTKKGSKFEPLK